MLQDLCRIILHDLSEALVQLDSEDIDAYGLVESEESDWIIAI